MPNGKRLDQQRSARRRTRSEPGTDERFDTEPDAPDPAGRDGADDDDGRRPPSDVRRRGARSSARRRDAEVLPANLAARAGLDHIAELTGKAATAVTSLDRTEHGWTVGVEVVEDRRVPSSADILAVYQTEVGVTGELLGYRRTRRYPRGRGDSGVG